MSLSGSVLLKVSEMQTLVFLELALELGVWLAVSVFARQLSTSANCLLVLSLQQGFDHKWVEELDLLDIRLVVRLVVGEFFQLGLLSTVTILGPETGKTVWKGWIV